MGKKNKQEKYSKRLQNRKNSSRLSSFYSENSSKEKIDRKQEGWALDTRHESISYWCHGGSELVHKRRFNWKNRVAYDCSKGKQDHPRLNQQQNEVNGRKQWRWRSYRCIYTII